MGTSCNNQYFADETADIEKLTDMMKELLAKVWGSDAVVFSDEAPTGNDPETLTLPHITYNMPLRVPMRDRTQKWTQFDSFPDQDNPGHNIILYRQWFECDMEFVIHCATRKEALRVAQRFEEFMNTYTGYFKERGVQEIVFKAETSPLTVDIARQTFATRTLNYHVRIERVSMVRSVHLSQIDSSLKFGEDSGAFSPQPSDQPVESSQEAQVSTKESNDFLSIYNQHYKSS